MIVTTTAVALLAVVLASKLQSLEYMMYHAISPVMLQTNPRLDSWEPHCFLTRYFSQRDKIAFIGVILLQPAATLFARTFSVVVLIVILIVITIVIAVVIATIDY